ncbi:MAG: hypothetical protein NTY34_03275 [Candidatus Omnitrophica bacterium]|nr:hypothetical protein [Candidatus Omnitrophota bacterium]
MKYLSILVIACLVSAMLCSTAYADSVAVLRQGLLGAGTGAVASAMSGGKGDRVWQSALAGAGITVVGGALLDMLTGERVGTVTYARAVRPAAVATPVRRMRPNTAYRRVYKTGFVNGYNRGYRDGYEDAAYELYDY